MNIVPAILPKNFEELEEKVAFLAGLCDVYHLDISDGRFAPSRTWPFIGDKGEYEAIQNEFRGMPRWKDIDFEAHLMTENTAGLVDGWIKAGAIRIILHTEDLKGDFLHEVVEEWSKTVEFSLAVKLETPVEALADCANDVRHLHIMTIENIGYQGQKLAKGAIVKVREVRKRFPGHIITVDGGVNTENWTELAEAGADRLIVGSAVFGSGSPRENLKEMIKMVEGGR